MSARFRLSFMLALLCTAGPALAGEMSVARIDQPVDIKSAPDPRAPAVAQAAPGDRYEILAAQEGWYQVQLFQDSYFLPKSTATEIIESLKIPTDEAKRKAVFRDLYKAEERAVEAAEKQALIEEKAVLEDAVKNYFIERAKLEVARKYGLPVPACIAIAFEGADQGWPVH